MELFNADRTARQLGRVFQRGLRQAEPYWNFGYTYLTRAVPELRSGLWFMGAPENVGKSQFQINLGYNALVHDPNVCWLDFSIDDSEEDRVGYLLARAGEMPISLVKRAGAVEFNAEDRAHREAAFRRFTAAYGSRYQLLGLSEYTDPDEEMPTRFSAEVICRIVAEAREKLNARAAAAERVLPKLLVTIDGFHDIQLDRKSQDENDRQRQKSQMLKDCATKENALFVMTAQVRQDSRKRGLTADIIRGDSGIIFDAKIVTHLYSDLNLNRENCHDLVWTDQAGNRMPVWELDILKNKCGGMKGILFYAAVPSRCFAAEFEETEQDYYRQCVFGAPNTSERGGRRERQASS